ncbi:MAG: Nucleotidyltransferase/DNA polymerase involved in repair [Candidatus Saccharibacteria bacterium]|nr:Nucleotidyltransferase/DNA polymerase involved in repair [Candidatus Saccharibacteria bacterium]
MNDKYNTATPLVMHIDLNSCFATVEQQARVRLRGKPVVVVNRRTDMTMIVTASYEAKAMGVKLGMRLRDAKLLCPELVGVESDPAKYKYVYHKLLDIMNDYSAHVTMKSIDEGVIDFGEAPVAIVERGLENIGREIKQRLRDEIGIAMRCNVGIATNRFLAKMAASLHKPDGLDIITDENLREVYSTLKLQDLTGIAGRNEHRLNAIGIMTPLQFLDASPQVLHDMVFQSINGDYWHQRLRGWEVDDVETTVKRVGRQYVLDSFTLSFDEILQRLHHLCESVGWRMRKQGLSARGIYVGTRTFNMEGDKRRNYWHASYVSMSPFFSDGTIYSLARHLFVNAPPNIRDINIHVYLLQETEETQVSLFADQIARERSVVDAIDELNDRYGEHTIHSADTTKTSPFVKTKIPFGSTRYL